MYDLNDPAQYEQELQRRLAIAMSGEGMPSGGKIRENMKAFLTETIRRQLDAEKTQQAAADENYAAAADPSGDLDAIRQIAIKLQSGGFDYKPDYRTVNNMYAQETGDVMRQFGQDYMGMEGMPRIKAALLANTATMDRRRKGFADEKQREYESKIKNALAAISAFGSADAGSRGNRQFGLNVDIARQNAAMRNTAPPVQSLGSSDDWLGYAMDFGKMLLTNATPYTPQFNKDTGKYEDVSRG